MARANPKSFCTKWVEMSDAMSDEEHAAEDELERDRKQEAWLSNNDPEYAGRQLKTLLATPSGWAWNTGPAKKFSLFKTE
jgi:hypothetical protein